MARHVQAWVIVCRRIHMSTCQLRGLLANFSPNLSLEYRGAFLKHILGRYLLETGLESSGYQASLDPGSFESNLASSYSNFSLQNYISYSFQMKPKPCFGGWLRERESLSPGIIASRLAY